MNVFEPDELDTTLRELLASRPVPPAPPDLARRAIRHAQAAQSHSRPALAPRRWRQINWLLNALAALWIIVLAGQQLHARYSAGGFQSWFSYEQPTQTATSTSTTTTTATASATTTESGNTPLWILGGGTLALLATAGAVAQRTTGDFDDAWRFTAV